MAPTTPLLSVSASHGAGWVALAVSGEIDMATEPTLTAELQLALARRPPTLVLDLSGVTFFGARALDAVIAAREAAGRNGCRLVLRSVPRQVERVMRAGGGSALLRLLDEGATTLPPRDGPAAHPAAVSPARADRR